MGFGRWRAPRWLRRRGARRSRRRVTLGQALACVRFVTVATVVDAHHESPSHAANDNAWVRRRPGPPLSIVR